MDQSVEAALLTRLGPRRHKAPAAAWLLAVAAAALSAAAGAEQQPSRPPIAIASCAGGPPIAFGVSDSKVLLEPADQDLVQAAMLERFPVLQRDGFAPQRIMLWHKGGQWLFVSLAASDETPPAPCFTATFAADGFELTRELIQKYFFADSAPA